MKKNKTFANIYKQLLGEPQNDPQSATASQVAYDQAAYQARVNDGLLQQAAKNPFYAESQLASAQVSAQQALNQQQAQMQQTQMQQALRTWPNATAKRQGAARVIDEEEQATQATSVQPPKLAEYLKKKLL